MDLATKIELGISECRIMGATRLLCKAAERLINDSIRQGLDDAVIADRVGLLLITDGGNMADHLEHYPFLRAYVKA